MTRFDIQKDPDRHWSVKEVAEYFSVSEDVIYGLVYKGTIEAISVGRCIRVRGSAIQAYEQSVMGALVRPTV
jgi:excisionase family DNA binding protein